MTELTPKTFTILSVSRAQDELLCKIVVRAALAGATEAEWMKLMHDTRTLMASRFFDLCTEFEARVEADPDVRAAIASVNALPDATG